MNGKKLFLYLLSATGLLLLMGTGTAVGAATVQDTAQENAKQVASTSAVQTSTGSTQPTSEVKQSMPETKQSMPETKQSTPGAEVSRAYNLP